MDCWQLPAQAVCLLAYVVRCCLLALVHAPLLVLRNVLLPPARPRHPGSVCFYEGVVSHTRRRPKPHSFRYPVRTAYISLDHPPAWFAAQQRDHMTAQQAREFAGTDGPVHLLTNPIAAGYTINPISVYYCSPATPTPTATASATSAASAAGTGAAAASSSSAATAARRTRSQKQGGQEQGQGQEQNGGQGQAGEAFGAAAAADATTGAPSSSGRCIVEVTNTPWEERVTFVVPGDGRCHRVRKALHVSPLMDMEATWHLELPFPDKTLKLVVRCEHPAMGHFFCATHVALKCEGRGAGARNEEAGLRALLRYGLLPHRIALWIYWHAVALLWKGVPMHGPPAKAVLERAAEGATHPSARGAACCPFVWRPAPGGWPWSTWGGQ